MSVPAGRVTAVSAELHAATPAQLADSAIARPVLSRRLGYIMLVRVLLYTILLGGTVILNLAWGTPEQLGTPYVTVLFVFIAAVYVLNIIYGAAFRLFRRLDRFAALQIGVDLVTSAVLVHLTGGAESAFILFFLLSPIAAAITVNPRAALAAAGVGTLILALVTICGYHKLLPTLHGQRHLPWDMSPTTLVRSLLFHGGAMTAIALLSGYLADQLRAVALHVATQQAQLDDLAQLNSDIIRCLTSGLVTVDDRGRVMTINQAAADILGVQARTARGRRLSELSLELAAVTDATDKPMRRNEIPLHRGDELRIVGVSTSPLTDRLDRRRGFIVNFQDLTALREMEQTMKRSEHLATIGRLAAGIAHEIRNPLGSISGSLELLQREKSVDSDTSKLMSIALREIDRLDNLIVDLLDFARPKRFKIEPMDLGVEIHRLVGVISGLLSGDNSPKLVVTRTEKGQWVAIDRDQFTAVLWNLVRNAWQAGEKEKIDIEVLDKGKESVQLLVTDRAGGIASDDLKQIFEPFFTTKAKGSGLGLTIVKRVIQEHGGTIGMRSKVGRGTTVIITLPRNATAGPAKDT